MKKFGVLKKSAIFDFQGEKSSISVTITLQQLLLLRWASPIVIIVDGLRRYLSIGLGPRLVLKIFLELCNCGVFIIMWLSILTLFADLHCWKSL